MPLAPRCIESRSTDPYTNLAIEACLMGSARSGEPVLYLWQNERTVVIGRNQCASAECDVERLEREGGHLARRRSGGGAVYHDLGNLCFTFVTTPEEYDQAAQTGVILDAVRALGIDAERTGRNDLVVGDGRKFSGHAYQHTGVASCHHGTIMVAVDVDALGRYLTVSPEKLRAKGVRSVRSRVTNLRALDPGITVEDLKDALRSAFATAWGVPSRRGTCASWTSGNSHASESASAPAPGSTRGSEGLGRVARPGLTGEACASTSRARMASSATSWSSRMGSTRSASTPLRSCSSDRAARSRS